MKHTARTDIAKTQEQLCADGVPHAVATVVRTLSSTAAKPGMKAIVLKNGDFAEGWLGGGCVTSAPKQQCAPSDVPWKRRCSLPPTLARYASYRAYTGDGLRTCSTRMTVGRGVGCCHAA